jgi:CPA2 family monovalent cation:H+ antiporter-2
VLAGALLSIIANPLIFGLLNRRAASTADSTVPADERPELPPGPDLPREGHAILVGYGRVGREIAKLLRDADVPLLVIDEEHDRVGEAHAAGFPAIRGNAASSRVMDEAAPERAVLAILAIPNALESGEMAARLRSLNPGITLLARAHSDSELRHLLARGADGAVLAERELAHTMAEMALSAPPFRKPRVPVAVP